MVHTWVKVKKLIDLSLTSPFREDKTSYGGVSMEGHPVSRTAKGKGILVHTLLRRYVEVVEVKSFTYLCPYSSLSLRISIPYLSVRNSICPMFLMLEVDGWNRYNLSLGTLIVRPISMFLDDALMALIQSRTHHGVAAAVVTHTQFSFSQSCSFRSHFVSVHFTEMISAPKKAQN